MSVRDRLSQALRLRRRRRRSLACNELVELITEYLEGSLPAADRARFETHVARCQGCRSYLDQMRQTIRAVGRLKLEVLPPRARDDLLEAFAAWKRT